MSCLFYTKFILSYIYILSALYIYIFLNKWIYMILETWYITMLICKRQFPHHISRPTSGIWSIHCKMLCLMKLRKRKLNFPGFSVNSDFLQEITCQRKGTRAAALAEMRTARRVLIALHDVPAQKNSFSFFVNYI